MSFIKKKWQDDKKPVLFKQKKIIKINDFTTAECKFFEEICQTWFE